MKNLFIITLISLAVLGLSACSKPGSAGGSSAAGGSCNSSKMSVAKLSLRKASAVLPGTYQLVAADYIWQIEGQTVGGSLKRESTKSGETKIQAKITCPEHGASEKDIGQQIVNSETMIPEVLIVNSLGKLELLESFNVSSITLTIDGRELRVSTKTEPMVLQQNGVSKDALQNRPEIVVEPVIDGFTVTINQSSESDSATTVAYFRLVKKNDRSPMDDGQQQPSSTPQSTPTPAATPAPIRLSKGECLEKTKVNLGRIAPENIHFTWDCSALIVDWDIPQIEITSVNGDLQGNVCNPRNPSTVGLLIQNGETQAYKYLEQLNQGIPELRFNRSNMSAGTMISYAPSTEGNTLIIPSPVRDSGLSGPNRNQAFLNGALSARVSLDGKTTCRFYDVLKEPKATAKKEKLIEFLKREFDMQFVRN